jgi:hypothetical protein
MYEKMVKKFFWTTLCFVFSFLWISDYASAERPALDQPPPAELEPEWMTIVLKISLIFFITLGGYIFYRKYFPEG